KRAMAERQVDELTWKDGLTGAYSRSAFHRDYDCGTFESIGFVLVDADRLAVVNRERSRDEGDEVLRRICSSMREVFGEGVYRIGDDEFCAVALPLEYEEFDRMTRSLTARFAEAGLPASVGLAWSERCEDATVLLNTAGDRMRRVKIGRHRATDLGIDLAQDGAVNDLIRPGGARNAVEARLLDIFLMPQVATQTGALVGAEALIRYLDPERGSRCSRHPSFPRWRTWARSPM
ncbi:MAG: diguanylate cyclase domain-containing protein, partial [Eggerthellaceae bacterium]